MKQTRLLTLIDNEATHQEAENDHSAAILLREAAEVIRAQRKILGLNADDVPDCAMLASIRSEDRPR